MSASPLSLHVSMDTSHDPSVSRTLQVWLLMETFSEYGVMCVSVQGPPRRAALSLLLSILPAPPSLSLSGYQQNLRTILLTFLFKAIYFSLLILSLAQQFPEDSFPYFTQSTALSLKKTLSALKSGQWIVKVATGICKSFHQKVKSRSWPLDSETALCLVTSRVAGVTLEGVTELSCWMGGHREQR